jgi:hypothetical protein
MYSTSQPGASSGIGTPLASMRGFALMSTKNNHRTNCFYMARARARRATARLKA